MNVQKKRKSKSNTDAVSPVIGVMLMIVVTIIIAAIVSAFAGGFADQQKKTPSTQIEVTLQMGVNSTGSSVPQLVFTHKGGDPVATHDLRIVTFLNGQKHVTDGSLFYGNTANNYATSMVNGAWPSTHFTSNNGYPCKVDSTGACLSDSSGYWGNTTFMNGDIMTTNINDPTALQSILGTSTLSPTPTPQNQNGIPISVEIVYIPSGNVISSTDLVYT